MPPETDVKFLEKLLARRSVIANNLGPPGPGREKLEQILSVAIRVPDHKVMAPWRFIVFEGEARAGFGKVLAAAYRADTTEPHASQEALEAERFLRAPVIVAVISRIDEKPGVPEWEQILSAGAACQNLLNGVCAFGYAAQWITEWYAYNDDVRDALGLAANERVAGFVYIGTAAIPPKPRRRPDLKNLISSWPT